MPDQNWRRDKRLQADRPLTRLELQKIVALLTASHVPEALTVGDLLTLIRNALPP